MTQTEERTSQTNPRDDDLFHVVSDDELDEGDRVTVDIMGREITVMRLDGEVYAVLNYCPHQGGPLCDGSISSTITVTEDMEWVLDREDNVIRCPWHGWGFKPENGEHVLNTRYRTPVYDVVIEDGEIYIDTS